MRITKTLFKLSGLTSYFADEFYQDEENPIRYHRCPKMMGIDSHDDYNNVLGLDVFEKEEQAINHILQRLNSISKDLRKRLKELT